MQFSTARGNATRFFFRYWAPVLTWMVFILLASSDLFSSEHTGSLLWSMLAAIFGRVEARAFLLLHFALRKAAHLTVYAVLSLLWFRAVRGGASGWRAAWTQFALLLSFLVAIADETLQGLSPSRGASARDVALDLAGAALAQLVVWIALRRYARRRAPASNSTAETSASAAEM